MATEVAKRRPSVSTREGSDQGTSSGGGPPMLSQAHRRMSRVLDPASLMSHGAARRVSMYRRPSLAGSQRTDLSHSVVAPPKLQPTYRMEPDPAHVFSAAKVSATLSGVLESFLAGEDYEASKCSAMAQRLTDHIKERVKDMDFRRYKIVCHVIIGQQGDQAIQAASRCIWETSTDNFAQGTFSNASLFAVANVYACYHN